MADLIPENIELMFCTAMLDAAGGLDSHGNCINHVWASYLRHENTVGRYLTSDDLYCCGRCQGDAN